MPQSCLERDLAVISTRTTEHSGPPSDPKLSVVFITYNRLPFLTNAVTEFRRLCEYPNIELIITDDGSPPTVTETIAEMPIDRLIKAEKNTGLGANSNRGLRACSGDYILHHQDDFVCCSNEPFIQRSIEILNRHPDVGLVRLHHITPFPARDDYQLADGTEYSILGFDQPPMRNGIYLYSDHPHLKRADFHEKAGYFTEGLKTGKTEDDFCLRFLESRPYKVATFWRSDLFLNVGMDHSTRTDQRLDEWRRHLVRVSMGRLVLDAYGCVPTPIRRFIRRRMTG